MIKQSIICILLQIGIKCILLTASDLSTTTLLQPPSSSLVIQSYHQTNHPDFLGDDAQWLWIAGSTSWPTDFSITVQSLFTSNCSSNPGVINITADDSFTLYLNSILVGSGSDWRTAFSFNVTFINGTNNLTAVAKNIYGGTPASVIFKATQNQVCSSNSSSSNSSSSNSTANSTNQNTTNQGETSSNTTNSTTSNSTTQNSTNSNSTNSNSTNSTDQNSTNSNSHNQNSTNSNTLNNNSTNSNTLNSTNSSTNPNSTNSSQTNSSTTNSNATNSNSSNSNATHSNSTNSNATDSSTNSTTNNATNSSANQANQTNSTDSNASSIRVNSPGSQALVIGLSVPIVVLIFSILAYFFLRQAPEPEPTQIFDLMQKQTQKSDISQQGLSKVEQNIDTEKF